MGPDATVFRVAGFRLLRVFSEYLGIDTTTAGSRPAAMSAQSPDLWSPVAIRRRVLPCAGRGTLLVAERVVRRDERAGTELETAGTRAERTGVHGVVPDNVLRNPVTAAFAVGSSPAIGRALRSAAPAARASEARCQKVMLLKPRPRALYPDAAGAPRCWTASHRVLVSARRAAGCS